MSPIAAELLKADGPWVFVGTIQNPTKRITPDDDVSFAYVRQSEDNSTIEYVFYISQSKLKEGDTLHLPLLEPQPGVTQHNAWFCFTRQHASYTERPLPSGDVQWTRNGPTQHELCQPPTSAAALGIVSPALAASNGEHVAASASQESNFVYTKSVVPDLCQWQTKSPSIVGQSFVICAPNVINAVDPGLSELKIYLTALQEERTDAGTKTSVLKKLAALNDAQRQRLDQISPTHAAYCDNQQAYPDPEYKEPLAMTLFDQARSSDPVIAAAATEAVANLQAETQFADFLARGEAACRNSWVLRLDQARAQRIIPMLGARGVSAVDVSALDLHTPDTMRTVIRPQATPNGDLYRVQVSIPASNTAALTCLAKVFRLVNIQDDAATVSPPADVDKEVDILKTRFAGKTRYVGWYSKIFQRDLLVGAHLCGATATAPT